MPGRSFTLTSFNAHAGLRPRTNGSCVPYDLVDVLERIAGDITVVQETWWPEGETSLVAQAAERLGAQLFELPFGRAVISPWPHVRRDRTGPGTIGLSMVKAIVERHGGTVEIDDSPLGGARFTVRLPSA